MGSAKQTEVIIIGAGPAGITTAIQLKRYGIPFLLFEKERIGGLLWNANLVENYPGFPNGVSGPGLIRLLEKQMKRIGVEVVYEEVINVDVSLRGAKRRSNPLVIGGLLREERPRNDITIVISTPRITYHATTLIIASGTKPLPFPIQIPEVVRSLVFSDVTHLLDVTKSHIAIVGAGDAAFDHALNLAKRGNSVTILNRGRDVKCLPLLAERIKLRPEIQYRDEVTVSGVESDRAGGLILHCQVSGSVEQIKSDYLVFAIGREPQQDFLSAGVREKEGELTSAGKLHFVGDVRNGLLRQTAIAAGDGLRAAMKIYLAKG
jgi:thioredoxin reductase